MILNRTNKTTLDEFLEKRGIEKNNFHLKENSILLQKILFMKRHQKNNTNYNQYFTNLTLNNFYLNQSSKRKNIFTRLQKSTKDNALFNENNKEQKKNIIYMNYISNFNKNSKDKNEKIKEEKKYDNLSINCNLFKDTLNTKDEKEKEYIFQTSTRRNNTSNENILNRINRNNTIDNNKYQNNTSLNKRFFETTWKLRANKWKDLIPKTNKKIIYKKKIKGETFNKKKPVSRNRISLLFPPNQSKENSICNSIDFSIINKTPYTTEKKCALSKTSENFFILSKKRQNNIKKINLNKNEIHTRNIKFMNHFIKYCYLYYIIIIKKFFNNLKKLNIPGLSNLISNSKRNNIFEEFNKEDFDRETINYKTMDNFFNDGINLSYISANKNKKNLVYNRNKRILNQKYQINNLMKILDISHIENEKSISNYEKEKYNFDNENKDIKRKKEQENNDNDIQRSPFFNGKSNISKNNTDIKDKDNIIGFIQVNNEINPFKIKNNNINFFNETKTHISENTFQVNEDEILSFRQKTSNDKKSIIKLLSSKTKDNKLNIDIKYFPYSFNKKKTNKYFNNELSIEKNNFKINNNLRIKKISMRVKNSKMIKEKEDYIDLTNEENKKNYLYSLSIIKEEDDEKNINDSSLLKSIPKKKIDHYFNISNNSKLYSKTSVEKLIDGDKVIKEEDMDNILFSNSSSYRGGYNKRSQEIMVVSNFCSVMRSRINRKENAKLLINGILILIQFFGNLCFNIRKSTFAKMKMSWKIKKVITSIIRYTLKKSYKKIKSGNKI